MCIELVNYWDKYTEVHGQQNVKIVAIVEFKVRPSINVLKSSGAKALQGLGRKSGRRRSAKLVPAFADRGVSRGQRNGSPRPLISVYLFYSISSSIDLTRLSVPRSRPTATRKIW